MQRLHQNDLAGWLLEGGNGEAWEHVCIPVRNEDGTPLWQVQPESQRTGERFSAAASL